MKMRQIAVVIFLAALVLLTGVGATEDFITVVVKDGDTITGIAKQYMKNPGRWQELLKYNNIPDPNHIMPGMTIKIPKSFLKNTPSTTPPTSDPTPAPAPSHPGPASPLPSPMPTTPLTGRAAKAGVIYVKGDVVRIPEKAAEEPLKAGAKLAAGDRLVTDSTAFAALSLPVGTEMGVGSDTRLKFEVIEENAPTSSGKIGIQLEQGRVRIKIKTRGVSLNIKAGSTSVSAGESELQFRYEDGGTRYLEVYKGKAQVTSGVTSVTVSAGNGIIVSGDAPSAAKPLLPAPVLKAYSFTSVEGPKGGVMWELSPKAVSLRIEIAEDEKFLKTVYVAGYAGTSLDFAFFQQFPPGKYAFRIIAVSAEGLWGAPSNSMVYNQ